MCIDAELQPKHEADLRRLTMSTLLKAYKMELACFTTSKYALCLVKNMAGCIANAKQGLASK